MLILYLSAPFYSFGQGQMLDFNPVSINTVPKYQFVQNAFCEIVQKWLNRVKDIGQNFILKL